MLNTRYAERGTWVAVYGAIGLAWVALYGLSLSHPPIPTFGALDRAFLPELWRQWCSSQASLDHLPGLFGMWALMAAAMMLPTALPFLKVYADIARHAPGRADASFPGIVLGYLATWLGFAAIAAFAQAWLAQRTLLSPHGILFSPYASAGLLFLAGVYQLSPAKTFLLSICHHPMHFIFSRWRGGPLGAFTLGYRHGLVCIGCCWALMLLAFVAGTMNLAWMGLATLIMVAEKLRPTARYTSVLIGAALVAASGFALSRAI